MKATYLSPDGVADSGDVNEGLLVNGSGAAEIPLRNSGFVQEQSGHCLSAKTYSVVRLCGET
jgi:hypothetical protein